MSGNHRAEPETSNARVAIAGALTAGALLLAPIGVAIAVPGVANATPQEDAVVQQMNDAGYAVTPAVIKNAYTVCNRLAAGQLEPQIVGDLTAATGDPVEAQKFFEVSRANLCP